LMRPLPLAGETTSANARTTLDEKAGCRFRPLNPKSFPAFSREGMTEVQRVANG
jgi:hypothetical protein